MSEERMSDDELTAGLRQLTNLRNGKDVTPHHIHTEDTLPVTQPVAQPVTNFLNRFTTVQEQTAKRCLHLADALEAEATKLKQYAATLIHQGKQIPEDVQRATTYEMDVRARVDYWAPVVKADA